jgi:hypothetical protein
VAGQIGFNRARKARLRKEKPKSNTDKIVERDRGKKERSKQSKKA